MIKVAPGKQLRVGRRDLPRVVLTDTVSEDQLWLTIPAARKLHEQLGQYLHQLDREKPPAVPYVGAIGGPDGD